jgi:tetratricopeptide (TPR) repeat protein
MGRMLRAMRRTRFAAVTCAVLLLAACAGAQVTKQDADLRAADGVKLKVTYFSAGKAGPAVLLLHQCNMDRKAWDGLAMDMAEAGINVVTLDYRGYGESGGERFLSLTPEQQNIALKNWPGDIETAYQYLLNQPGVDKTRIGAGGASCGVNNAVHVARRHAEVKTLVLLSGPVDDATIQFVEKNEGMPILSAASEEDGDMLPTMRWLMGFARNPENKLLSYNGAGHGAEMFKAEKGLPSAIVAWYEKTLNETQVRGNAKSAGKPSAIQEFWDTLAKPGGAARAAKMLEEAKKKDPNAFLFPESAINLMGYQLMMDGKMKEAIEILKINVMAYPQSANVYDSLGDAYQADHQTELALEYSEKALKALKDYPPASAAMADGIRQSAEDKIKKLKAK